MSTPQPLTALIKSASAYYRPAGTLAWHFARLKLRTDPVFRAILEHGALKDRTQLLDLGAGQGLLAAWLLAARSHHAAERSGWPSGWPAPPQFAGYTGIEINPQEVRRGQRAFARDTFARVQIVHGDIRDVNYGTPDAIVMLDVLHYNDYASQERILARVRAALSPGGVLLLRVGDAQGGIGFTLSKALDSSVALARRGRWIVLKCRAVKEWEALLAQLGFTTRRLPMRAGMTTNTLILAQLP